MNMPGSSRYAAIALAFATLSPVAANAQSSVQVYGIVDAVVGSFKASGDSAATVGLLNGGQTTSFYGIRGTEDLGGGYKADFEIEGYFLVNTGQAGRFTGDTTYSRNAYVDLAGPYGTLRFGRMVTTLFYITARTNPIPSSYRFSPLQTQTWIAAYGRNVLGDTGWDSAILYESPSIHGVKFSVMETAPGTGAHNQSAALVYDRGPLYLAGLVQRVKYGLGFTPGINHQDTYFLGGAYNFQYVHLYASYAHNAESKNGAIDNTYQGGVAVPFGNLALQMAYSRTNTTVGGGAPDHSRDTAGVTFDYHLSKRTDLYASYLFDKLSNAGTANSFGVGIRQVF
ncbi:porin [Paraburkholderia sp. GAS334]|uniref:porin n=1 Tax=Paraburkholderia sp. GAS334 TaxID=3035131 RepID=UPI003D23C8E6